MSKKIFTLALLAVFVLAQFSLASATAEPGAETAIAALPTFHNAGDVSLDWSVTGMDGTGTQNLFLWARSATIAPADWDPNPNFCYKVANLDTLTNANGTYVFHTDDTDDNDQDVVEFMATVSDWGTCALAFADISADDPAQASTFIDEYGPIYSPGQPPSAEALSASAINVSCNTFEIWSLVSDDYIIPDGGGYSGFKAWNQSVTGTFAPPAPEGNQNALLSWVYTLPATASGPWTFRTNAEDMAGNKNLWIYRNALPIVPSELEDCVDFSDVAGDPNEVYIRYLADLGLISGFADGTYGPDKTLTRAEASTLFEIANGYDETMLPPSAPTGCDFTDVSATDWFAGWVWQACSDGFMNGIGGGLFDPNNLLTRGQVVTVMNNIANNLPWPPTYTSYLDSYSFISNAWDYPVPYRYQREAAWTDVAIGDYYAQGVIRGYGWGIVDGTSDGTFSPNIPITRSLFAKWLYRALSRYF